MLKQQIQQKREEGFTLIELLIVIIILAILAAIVVFAVGTTSSNSKKAACDSDAKSVETAVEAYKAQVGSYPSLGTAGMAQLTTTNANGGPWLRQAPRATVTANGYAISLDAATAGQVDVTVGTTTTNFDSATDPCASIP